jgi:nitrogen regulatory protein P-II 1
VQLVSAVVHPMAVTRICEALQAFGFRGFTMTEVSGFGKQRDRQEIYRGAHFVSDFQPHTKIDVLVADEESADVVHLICRVAATDHPGDGQLWVTPVASLVRIGTGEMGAEAL